MFNSVALAQRNGVEVVVLEARDRVGGRVHSYQGDFACPVDLGASIITGTEVRDDAAVHMPRCRSCWVDLIIPKSCSAELGLSSS